MAALGRVVRGVLRVSMRYVGMMSGFFVGSTFVVRGGFPMMARCVLVVLRGGEVVLMFHFGYLLDK